MKCLFLILFLVSIKSLACVPLDCKGDWTSCPVKCDANYVLKNNSPKKITDYQYYFVKVKPILGGKECPSKHGAMKECKLDPCTLNSAQVKQNE